ncbi:MAG: GFA family protein [Rhodospirillales bacterium]|nr:GFA family protein [Rhodospirillales bacterium]
MEQLDPSAPARVAACACGQLRAVCAGAPPRVFLCACTQCQRRTGSMFGVSAFFDRAQVRIEGTAKRWRRSSDSGRHLTFGFCPECGGTVFWEAEVDPDSIGIAAGTFADPGFPKPQLALWTETKCDWVRLPEGVPVKPARR